MVPKAEKRKNNYGLVKLIVIFVTLFQYMILSQISVKRMLQLMLRRACTPFRNDEFVCYHQKWTHPLSDNISKRFSRKFKSICKIKVNIRS